MGDKPVALVVLSREACVELRGVDVVRFAADLHRRWVGSRAHGIHITERIAVGVDINEYCARCE